MTAEMLIKQQAAASACLERVECRVPVVGEAMLFDLACANPGFASNLRFPGWFQSDHGGELHGITDDQCSFCPE